MVNNYYLSIITLCINAINVRTRAAKMTAYRALKRSQLNVESITDLLPLFPKLDLSVRK